MEDWLKEAKEIAQYEAKDFVENMKTIAEKKDLDFEWFLEEVVANIHKIKKEISEPELDSR